MNPKGIKRTRQTPTCPGFFLPEKTLTMDKGKMIAAIIRAAKDAAILRDKYLDVPDLFFTLIYFSDETLKGICDKLGIR
jgi:hypothetical protein